MQTKWILCPICGNKTRDRIREDTVLKNYPLYCPKCKQETLINVFFYAIFNLRNLLYIIAAVAACCVPVSHEDVLARSAFRAVYAVL